MRMRARFAQAALPIARAVLFVVLAIAHFAIMSSLPVVAQSDRSPWTSFRPRSSLIPLITNTGFLPGQYMIYVGNADPLGMTVGEWQVSGPVTLQPGDKWLATLMPHSVLRLERDPAALLNHGRPPQGLSQVYAANEDPASWQAICVLPVGVNPRPTCFEGTRNITDVGVASTFSRWNAITPDSRQFAGQPGSLWPLRVIGYPNFVAGAYMIYVANAGPAGRDVSRWNSFGPVRLVGGDKWQATLRPGAQLQMDRNPATLISYTTPDIHHAMIYVRNEDPSTWQAICVLPTGADVQTMCFGGSNKITYVPEQKPVAAGIEGQFRGRATFRYRRQDETAQSPSSPADAGQIDLTVRAGTIVGTMVITHGDARVAAQFSGRVEGTNRFVAVLEGRSVYTKPFDQTNKSDRIAGIIVKSLFEFPFQGQISGTFESGAWSGVFEARSTDQRAKPVGLSGAWTTDRQP